MNSSLTISNDTFDGYEYAGVRPVIDVPKERIDLMLSCYSIRFKHPTQEQDIEISALPRSKKWKKILDAGLI